MTALNLGMGMGLTQRTGGSWNPFSLGALLLAWWDSAQGVSLSGNQVTAWADRKGGYSAVQGVSAARPIYSATGFNGMPGLTFDGVDDILTLDSQPFPSGADPSEIWAVVQQDALAADATVRHAAGYGGAVANDRRTLARLVSTVNRAAIQYGTGAANVSATETSVDLSSRHLLRGQYTSAAGARLTVDGATPINTGTITAPGTGTTRLTIGGSTGLSGFWNGKIRDVLITGPLSADQAAALRNFLLLRRML